jgi:hypothetical protein
MNTSPLFKVDTNLLTRDQIIALARRAEITADDLSPPLPNILRDNLVERHIERKDNRVVRLIKIQDSKYGVLLEPVHGAAGTYTGSLANLTTGMPIPSDEPVMIFRGQDTYAMAAIETYVRTVTGEGNAIDPRTADSAQERFMAFQTFASSHPDRMKRPD